MTPEQLGAVVDGFLRHHRHFRDGVHVADDDPDTVANDTVIRIIFDGPASTAWDLVLDLLRRSPDEDLGYHAAGPLEDLVCTHGEELVGVIEAEARRDARFRWALGAIWLSRGALPAPILDRIVLASGGAIKPLP